MIDATKPHNWIVLALMVVVIGFALHQVAARVPAANGVVRASFGA